MSMLHSIVAASRLTRQDLRHRPLSVWPSGRTASTPDILIEGRSLIDLAHAQGTPVAFTYQAGSLEADDGQRTVVLTAILRRVKGGHRALGEITVDCDLRSVRARCMDVLLLNRPRSLARTPMLIRSRAHQSPSLQISLPGDTSSGDFLALVCRGTIAANQVRLDDRHANSDGEDWPGRCMK